MRSQGAQSKEWKAKSKGYCYGFPKYTFMYNFSDREDPAIWD
jgi:hypothetical protein